MREDPDGGPGHRADGGASAVRCLVLPGSDRTAVWTVRTVSPDGGATGPGRRVAAADLPALLDDLERRHRPRWVWSGTATVYPQVVADGVRLGRCHDLAAVERLLLGHEQRWSELAALPSPDGPAPAATGADGGRQQELFGAEVGPGDAPEADQDGDQDDDQDDDQEGTTGSALRRATAADQDQRHRLAADPSGRLALLAAAESAGTLLAVEMGRDGLPWDAAAHDALLTDLLGPRPRHGRPDRLQRLAEEVAVALDDPRLNPDSPADLLRSLRRAGLPVTSTNRHELARHEHPVLPLVRRYKELARLWTSHGWTWRETWVQDGRFRPEYVPGGVVSGRWATRGGGALQIPRAVRGAVRAGPGQVLVIADAGQLEPRVLAALSGDAGMVAATRAGDLYSDLAARALGSPEARGQAKLALLSAMYGGGTAASGPLRRQFPRALALLEEAARAGEDGAGVVSVLGRRCPPAPADWLDGLADPVARERTRARGRFTRNFVVQASAADWAAVWIAALRRRLAELDPGDAARLVFFQHDEVIVEAPEELAGVVVRAVGEAGEEATGLVLGGAGVRIPLLARAVSTYSDKEPG